MKKTLIVEASTIGQGFMRRFIEQLPLTVKRQITLTDSFDHALSLIAPDGDLTVIASHEFHDDLSEWRKKLNLAIPDEEKNGNILARMIKEINPDAKVYIFSEYQPGEEYIDGYIQKHREGSDTLDAAALKEIVIDEREVLHGNSDRRAVIKVIPIMVFVLFGFIYLLLKLYGQSILDWITHILN